MARVFLSVLGTSDYLPCRYALGEGPPGEPVRFVQEAILAHYCADWTSGDRIVVFVTERENGEAGSRERNWEDNGHEGSPHGRRPNGAEGLRTRIAALIERGALPAVMRDRVEAVTLRWGKTGDEIWENFRIIAGRIERKDEVVFDITHSFRSLPMLAFAVLLYVRHCRDITVDAVTYGAFEVLGGNPGKVARDFPDPRDRIAPVFDLSPLLRVAQWSEAAMSFMRYGETVGLEALLKEEANRRLAIVKGADPRARAYRRLADRVGAMGRALKGVRGRDIVDMAGLHDVMEPVGDDTDNGAFAPVTPLLADIDRKTAAFEPGSLVNGLHAARFCLEHGLLQQAVTILQETMISLKCSDIGLDWRDRTHRDIVSAAPALRDKPESEWHGKPGRNREITRRAVESLDEAYLRISDLLSIRDDLNHAGMRANATSYDRIRGVCTEALDKAFEWAARRAG